VNETGRKNRGGSARLDQPKLAIREPSTALRKRSRNSGSAGRSERRPGVKEVANLAGVAISSVSRVLLDHPDVSSDMRRRVLEAVNTLGYQPDFLAQSLRSGRTFSVGFIVGDISNPTMASLVLGAEEVIRAAGLSLLLMNSGGDPAQDEDHIRFFVKRRVDGMLLSLASETNRPTLRLLGQVKAPIVVLDREIPAKIGANAVLSNHREGMRAAVDYLLDLGHRRIALIGPSLEMRAGRERIAGMRDAMAARGGRDETMTRPGSLSAEHGEAATNELFSLNQPPTAIIAGGNQLLVGTLRALASRGLRVGKDVALVTCDDFPLSELHSPPIATIARDIVGMGRAAAQLLLARIQQPGEPAVVILPTSFHPRASASPLSQRPKHVASTKNRQAARRETLRNRRAAVLVADS
jgi:LacI family transcriptional regulator